MNTTEVDTVLARLLEALGQEPAEREEIRVWARSGVERLRFDSGASVVFKYAEGPFADEHTALDIAAMAGLPVPERLAVVRTPTLLGMLLEDLGPAVRNATDAEGAQLAVGLHMVADTGGLPVVNESVLAGMPARMLQAFTHLSIDSPARDAAAELDRCAAARSHGADLAPFGLCHSEWHPTSVHLGRTGTHLLDFARAFRGPGLLDLASWPGTITDPDPDHVADLIEAYITAGGPATARAERGELPAARWALGWHRVWAADWFTHQMTIGWATEAEEAWTNAITRHLTEAAALLG